MQQHLSGQGVHGDAHRASDRVGKPFDACDRLFAFGQDDRGAAGEKDAGLGSRTEWGLRSRRGTPNSRSSVAS